MFTEWSRRPAFRIGAGMAILVLSSALLVLLVASTGYDQLLSRMSDAFASQDLEAATHDTRRVTIGIASGASANSIAVLPFRNLTLDGEGRLFASNVQSQVMEALSVLADIEIAQTKSVAADPHDSAVMSELAVEVNAGTLLVGKVKYDSGFFEVEVELIDASTLATLWRKILNGNALEMFGFRADIAASVGDSLGLSLTPAERERIGRMPTVSHDAYVAFSKAKALILEGIEGPQALGNRLAVQNLLDEALEFDPRFAAVHAWKALVYSRSKTAGPPGEAEQNHNRLMDHLAEQSALTAIALSSELGLPHAVLARIHADNMRYEQAEAEAERALELSPHYAEVLAVYALVETEIRHRPAEAIPYLERAIALSPNDAVLYAQLGADMTLAGRGAEAEAVFGRCRSLDPEAAICPMG